MLDLCQQVEHLRRVPMFAKLEPSKLKLLAFTSEMLSFEDGEEVFRSGDPADCAYVIMAGEVTIMAETEQGEVPGFVRGTHELVGEMALLTNSPRSASVRSKGQMTAMRISDDMFIKLLTENPDIALDVMRQLSVRLAQTHQRFEKVQGMLQRYETTQ